MLAIDEFGIDRLAVATEAVFIPNEAALPPLRLIEREIFGVRRERRRLAVERDAGLRRLHDPLIDPAFDVGRVEVEEHPVPGRAAMPHVGVAADARNRVREYVFLQQ